MSLFTAISSSLSGMNALQANMQLISNNVSNTQNENYTRKSIHFTSDPVAGGVLISGYSRATDESLTNLLRQSSSDAGKYSVQSDYLARVQDLYGSSQDNPALTNLMSDFAASWRVLAAEPESSTLQQDVVFRGQSLAREVNRLATGLTLIKNDVANDVTTAVAGLNTALQNIERLNGQILAATANGQENIVNSLIDQRDGEIVTLSKLVDVRVYERYQNTVGIYTPQGLSLLDNTASQFSWNGTTITLSGSDVTDQLAGGSVEGLVGLLDQGTTSAALNDPGMAIIYKAEQQLLGLVTLFTDSGETFATAYDNASLDSDPNTTELDTGFFTGTTAAAFQVNASLLDGSAIVKLAAARAVADDMDVGTRTFTAAGLTATSTDYAGITDAIIAKQNQNTKTVKTQADTYESQRSSYEQRLRSQTGVNIDEEIANLVILQNNYSASAHVLNTIQQMFQTLERLS